MLLIFISVAWERALSPAAFVESHARVARSPVAFARAERPEGLFLGAATVSVIRN